ncbi:hypothetical protein XAB3213_4140053 [Xanthomonas citri pv. bilvae]|nr:hypothetical protein XAB3213_4140053 [Xanthomonas citri pv. bilvae]
MACASHRRTGATENPYHGRMNMFGSGAARTYYAWGLVEGMTAPRTRGYGRLRLPFLQMTARRGCWPIAALTCGDRAPHVAT